MGPLSLQMATTPGGSAEVGQLKSQDFHIRSMLVSDISGTDVKKTFLHTVPGFTEPGNPDGAP